jgi:hypothetical protein
MRPWIALLVLSAGAALANAEEMFPFVMPGLEPNRGITDMSWLNDMPAGKDGPVRAQDGHFVDGRGRRINFLATNFTFGSNFPEHATAEKLAVRLASFGINCIRFHHMDNHSAPGGIWKAGTPRKDQLDREQLDRLDYFIAQLKKQGIYADLNLHVSRNYWEGESFPDGLADDRQRQQTLPGYGKGLDKINDQMIRMQRDYARALLTHVNPYTKTAYAAEPSVAIVEINNENTLLGLKVGALPDYYRNDILRKWNAWLKARYTGTEQLVAAWGGSSPLGPSLLTEKPAEKWIVQQRDTDSLAVEGAPGGLTRVVVKKLPATNWHLQLQLFGLTLDEDKLYTLEFTARSEKPRRLPVSVRLQKEDWHNCGLNETAELAPAWKTFSYTFRAVLTEAGAVRLDFVLGDGPLGEFSIKQMSLRRGGSLGLKPGETLEAASVGSGERGPGPRHHDWVRFLAQTERAYAAGLREFLKKDLGVRANIIDTQASYGGVAGAYRESESDYVDMHAYWQHPHFLHRAWDMSDWMMPNTAMVAAKNTGTLLDLAVYRVAGKAFTVSEYDHPAPSNYSAEMFPMVASFAAVQDWDGIFQFDWGGTTMSDKIGGFFSLQQHPGKLAFLPAAALMFRRGDVAAARGSVRLAIPSDQAEELTAANVSMPGAWHKAGVDLTECLARRLNVSFVRDSKLAAASHGAAGSQVAWDHQAALYTVDAPAAKAIVGRSPGKAVKLDGIEVDVKSNSRNFAVLTVSAIDGRPSTESRRLLLTAAGNVENTAMNWNAAHTSVGNQWGRAPTICEGIAAQITLTTNLKTAKIFALDSSGQRVGPVPAKLADGKLRFEIGPQFKTLWYEIAAE